MIRNVRRHVGYFLDKVPYVRKLRKMVRDAGAYPPGHFHSPIPDRTELLERIELMKRAQLSIPEIKFNHEQQLETLKSFARYYDELPFSNQPTEACRYYYDQSVFCHPDGIFLYTFLRQIKPTRIIEVGSGLSSAVILDTVDRFFETRPQITFIEPHPIRLNQILRYTDRTIVNILETRVQKVPLDLFLSLGVGDLLFVDSSHIMKCGSDVQFLLFDVLPRLPVGVYVHFHDIFQTFEYLEDWLLEGTYWNEAYLLRAFLANNSAWEIYFFNNYVRTHFEDYLAKKMPLCLRNIGGSLYLRRTANNGDQ
jgi:hypothetical protein